MSTFNTKIYKNENEVISFVLEMNNQSAELTETALGIDFLDKIKNSYKVRETNNLPPRYPVRVRPELYIEKPKGSLYFCNFSYLYLDDLVLYEDLPEDKV